MFSVWGLCVLCEVFYEDVRMWSCSLSHVRLYGVFCGECETM